MARNKQKKNVSVPTNRPSEGGTGQRKDAKSGGRVAGGEGLDASGEVSRRRGRKASTQAAWRVKYQKRYDGLLTPDIVSGCEVRLSESPSPSAPTRISSEFTPGTELGSQRLKASYKSGAARNSSKKISQNRSNLGLHSYSSVSFAYKDMEASRDSGRVEEAHSSPEDAVAHVVLPASDGRAEVVTDRRGSQGSLTSWPVQSSVSTWGLGYVQNEVPGVDMEYTAEEKSGKDQVGHAFEERKAEEHIGHAVQGRPAEEYAGFAVEERLAEEHAGFGLEEMQAEEHAGFSVEESLAEEHAGFAVEEMAAEEHAGYAVGISVEDHVGYTFETGTQTSQQVVVPASSLGASKIRLSDHADIGSKQTGRKSAGNNAYLTIGGLRIFTTDMPPSVIGEDQDTRVVHRDYVVDDDDDDEEVEEEDGLEDWLSKFRRRKKRGRQSRKARFQQAFNPYEVRASLIDSSDGDESSPHTDSDIGDDLVDDYLANCEGLSADLDDPAWVRRNANSLRQVPIEHMPLDKLESRSSESSSLEDLDKEEDGAFDSGSEGGCSEHCDEVTAGDFQQRVTLKQRNKKVTVDNDFEVEYFPKNIIFGSDSDTSCSDEGTWQGDFAHSDDLVHIHDLDLNEEARRCVLELQDSSGDAVEVEGSLRNLKQQLLTKKIYVPHEGFDLGKEGMGAGSVSANCREDACDMASTATQTWPFSRGGRSTKNVKVVPGQKKQDWKETIATKRRDRALQRGFDLSAVSKVLEDMVMKKKDIVAFEPMKPRDRAQVHRVASIYGLKSGSQGSTKKRFVVVSCTRNTGMPSGDNKLRLLKLLGKAVRTPNRPEPCKVHKTSTSDELRMFTKTKQAALQALHGWQPSSSGKSRDRSIRSSQGKNLGTSKGRSQHISRHSDKSSPLMKQQSAQKGSNRAVYANNPVSFTATGMMGEEENRSSSSASNICFTSTRQETLSIIRSLKVVADPTCSKSEFAVFEAHTKGFGSRMMAKMGYREGLGLGRDKQGIAEPVEAIKRPKSLGLGAQL